MHLYRGIEAGGTKFVCAIGTGPHDLDQRPASYGHITSTPRAAWRLEARYLAAGGVNLICTLPPRRVITGGGVMDQMRLFAMIREEVCAALNGYVTSGRSPWAMPR